MLDLLNHYPREYEDRTEVLDNFSLINIKEKNTILVKLVSINTQKTANNKLLTKAVFEDKSGFMSEGVWFNRRYLSSQLSSFSGRKVLISGKVKYAFGKITFQSPEVETDLSKIGGEIVPIYSDINYIPSKWLDGKIELLKSFIGDFKDTLPENIVKKYDFISKAEAVYKIHFPKSQNDIEVAKYRLGYEELFHINYKAISSKYEKFRESAGRSVAIPMNVELVKEILAQLPFDLTNHQKIALFQILKDMEKPHAMARLLEGDVGTGKTVVALIAVIHGILESRGISESLELGTKVIPHPQPLSFGGEGSLILASGNIGKYSVRKGKLKSPGYVFELAKKFRKNLTFSEETLWGILRSIKIEGSKFRRQHPIGRYIADFYLEDLNLIIELDGKVHENEIQKGYDEERNNLLKNYGFSILRLNNNFILNNSYKEIIKKIEEIMCYPPLLQRRGVRGEGENIQVSIMAPTEILAMQHFNSMQGILFEYGISSELLVGSTTAKHKKEIKEKLKTGNLDVIIGTHALVQDDVIFKNLGFVIIDEQHRFGVKQREKLEKNISAPLSSKGEGLGVRGIIPHSLNMTATPIPRTLALTLYGDQDLSVINEYPKGRKEIFTKVAHSEGQRQEIELFVESELNKGRQVFWVSPLVEESEKLDLANAINTFETLQAIYQEFSVGLVHGKMKPKDKEKVMQDFKDNKIQVLSSTTVIEVGIDIPNASIICIEGAERFGLSQLHQIRGRVGRGEFQSYCYLFPTKGQKTDRLRAMERTNNGFELSEIDLELRGPGEVYGLKQSGVPDLKVAELTDLELISKIREDIEELFNKKEK
ncbi:MAG: DUF559 domain-containing protein [Candidatus Gracilibacteria bacterium]|nr:DUF559 domain-containing protein [Candidatus Gracilibacteria bacterium]